MLLAILSEKLTQPSAALTPIAWAAFAIILFSLLLPQKKSKKQKKKPAAKAWVLILGLLMLFFMIALFIGIFYFFAIGKYLLAILSGILLAVLITVIGIAAMKS
jgi:L-asparagine transporter-like permease